MKTYASLADARVGDVLYFFHTDSNRKQAWRVVRVTGYDFPDIYAVDVKTGLVDLFEAEDVGSTIYLIADCSYEVVKPTDFLKERGVLSGDQLKDIYCNMYANDTTIKDVRWDCDANVLLVKREKVSTDVGVEVYRGGNDFSVTFTTPDGESVGLSFDKADCRKAGTSKSKLKRVDALKFAEKLLNLLEDKSPVCIPTSVAGPAQPPKFGNATSWVKSF